MRARRGGHARRRRRAQLGSVGVGGVTSDRAARLGAARRRRGRPLLLMLLPKWCCARVAPLGLYTFKARSVSARRPAGRRRRPVDGGVVGISKWCWWLLVLVLA